jgi:hypothetical protein
MGQDDVDALEREMKTWLRVQNVRGDNPTGTFGRWQDSYGDWYEWSPREEADWVRWGLMEDDTSYDDADAEMQVVMDVEASSGPDFDHGAQRAAGRPLVAGACSRRNDEPHDGR